MHQMSLGRSSSTKLLRTSLDVKIGLRCPLTKFSLHGNFVPWIPLKEKLELLVGVAKTLTLRKELQHHPSINISESVEIFLNYETRLKEKLRLVTAIDHMRYGSIGRLEDLSEDTLVETVENSFWDELAKLPQCAQIIESHDDFKRVWAPQERQFVGQIEQLENKVRATDDCPPQLNEKNSWKN